MPQERFEQGAATWDDNPGRIRNAEAIAAAILRRAPVSTAHTAVDYGCGTGLVTLAIAPNAGHIVAIDSSPAMLSALRSKAADHGLTNVETVEADLEHDEPPTVEADLVVSTMVLHHVTDVSAVLRRLTAMLRTGGVLAVADLDAEDGSFHTDHSGVVHFGFDRSWMQSALGNLGLVVTTAETANTIEREGPDGVRRYPVFLICARRP